MLQEAPVCAFSVKASSAEQWLAIQAQFIGASGREKELRWEYNGSLETGCQLGNEHYQLHLKTDRKVRPSYLQRHLGCFVQASFAPEGNIAYNLKKECVSDECRWEVDPITLKNVRWNNITERPCLFRHIQEVKSADWKPPLKRGEKRILLSACEDVQSGSSVGEMWDSHPMAMYQYRGGLKEHIAHVASKRPAPPGKPRCLLLYGDSGCHKSYGAIAFLKAQFNEHFGKEVLVIESTHFSRHSFFPDRYDGHSVILLNEFEGQAPFTMWKGWMDGPEFCPTFNRRIQAGGDAPNRVKLWIITTNKEPYQWYPKDCAELGFVNFQRMCKMRITATLPQSVAVLGKAWVEERLAGKESWDDESPVQLWVYNTLAKLG